MNQKTKVPEILGLLAAAFPKFTLTEDTVKAYTLLLDDIPSDLLRAAALQCARMCTFFPSVHEIMEAVSEIQSREQGLPTAFEAWEDLVSTGLGEWRNVDHEFLHPMVKRVGKMLGWPRIFPSQYLDKLSTDRAHFIKAYEAEVKKSTDEQMMHPEVKGYIEQQKLKQLEAGNGYGSPRGENKSIGAYTDAIRERVDAGRKME